MVGLARSSNLTRLRDRGRDLRLNAMDVEVLARRQREARDFSHWRDELGMVCGAFRLQPIPGIAFINRLEAEADRLRAEAKKQIAGAEVPEPRGRYVADAFVKMLETGSATGKAVRADVVFVQDVTSGASHLVGGGPVPKSAVGDAVAAGAFVKAVLHDGVDITTVAHYGKSMPAHLRTALELGRPPTFDGVVCEVCGSPFGLEWDHVDPRANGGAWSATNIRPKCWPCHHDKTEADRRAGLLGPGKGGGRPRRSGREPERGPP
jgi:hypothetical protein